MTLRTDVELQEHQQRVMDKLNKSRALLLYHQLGSGKSLSSIAATSNDVTDVITPASLRENYKKELGKFTTDNKSEVMSHHGYLKMEGGYGDSLVVDEAHRLGNPSTQITKKLLKTSPAYKKLIMLTGSPITNKPEDLAPLIQMLNPNAKVPMRGEFNKRFVGSRIIRPSFFRSIAGDLPREEKFLTNESKLRGLVRGKVDYHASDLSNFPSVSSSSANVEMSPEQYKMYRDAYKDVPKAVYRKIEQGIPLTSAEKKYLNSFLGASRQISNVPSKFGDNDLRSPKIDRVVSDHLALLESNKDNKGVIYSNYLEGGLGAVESALTDKGIPFRSFTGKLNDKGKKEAVDAYNRGEVRSLLLSGAGSEGIDLKGTRMVQMMEPHWHNTRLNQVQGRAARYKSHSHLPEEDRNVIIKKYVSTLPEEGMFFKTRKRSVDQYLSNLADEKDNLNNQFLEILQEEGSR